MTTAARSWRFQFSDIPIGPNHQHELVPYLDANGKPRVRKVLTKEARRFMEDIGKLAGATGFRMNTKSCYRLSVHITVPNWRYDVDCTKALADGIFGTRYDQRNVELH